MMLKLDSRHKEVMSFSLRR